MKNRIGIAAAAATALRAWGPALVIGTTLATVAAVTGFISYTHICALTLSLHQSWKTAHLMPLAVDGQIVIGSVIFMALPDRNRFWGLVGVVPGLAESLFANWESGAERGLLDASWATVAAQAFAVSSFLFERWLKAQAGRVAHAVHAVPATPENGGESPRVPEDAPDVPGESAPMTPVELLVSLANSGSLRDIAELTGASKTTVGRWRKLLDEGAALVPDASQDVPLEPSIRYAPELIGASTDA